MRKVHKLQVVSVLGVGTENERVFLKANEDLDLEDYIITDSTYRKDGIKSNQLRHVYEFKSRLVNKGEYVSLHSKAGEDCMDETSGIDPAPLHRIFWGLKERIWNQAGDQAHVLYAPTSGRQTIAVPAAKKVVSRV